MKISTPIGQFITKSEIIICPECEGKGIVFCWPDNTDDLLFGYCEVCEGKRVLEKVEHVFYKRTTDKGQSITENQ